MTMEVDLGGLMFCHVNSPASRLEISELIDDVIPDDAPNASAAGNDVTTTAAYTSWMTADYDDVPMATTPIASAPSPLEYCCSFEATPPAACSTVAGLLSPPNHAGHQLRQSVVAAAPQTLSTAVGDSSGGGTAGPTTSAAPLLPPCRVCGEKASGFHYGANTCEACKV